MRRGQQRCRNDISRRSIEYAREHDKSSEYINADYLNLDRSSEFDAALLIYCDYAALTQPEREQLLKNALRALKPGGLFILDVFTIAGRKPDGERKSWSMHENGGFWSEKPYICLDAVRSYENDAVQARQTVILTENSAAEYIIWDTYFSRKTLESELTRGGFEVKKVYADICGAPYSPDSETLCVVANRPLK